MRTTRRPQILALSTFAIWITLTIALGAWQGGGHAALTDLVTHGPLWSVFAAAAFLAAATVAGRWKDIGFTPPHWPSALRLQWVPLGYVLIFLGLAVAKGLPAPGVILWVFINTLVVGLSEEWMCRGILLQGLREGGSLRRAIWLSTLLFGLVHSLNVFVTGELIAGLVQAGAATMSGLLFCAIRVRTKSLWPVILTHGLYDGALFLMTAGGAPDPAPAAPAVAAAFLVPIALITPNFVYGLYLLRPSALRRAGLMP